MGPLVVANWKMNGSEQLLQAVVQQVEGLIGPTGIKVVLALPAPYLSLTKGFDNTQIEWAGQNVHWLKSGAYTGEVSASMLLELGAGWSLVGHSERRAIYGESDEMVAQKFILAQKMNLIPMLCVGESQQERESNQTKAVVSRQIDAVIAAAGISAFERSVIAYEPVWAIGTGLTATPQQAQEVHAQIREQIAQKDDRIAQH